MKDTASNNVASTDRARKSKALKIKKNSARDKGVTLIEGAFLAVKDGSFSVFVWNGTEWVPRLTGTVTKDFLEKT